MAEDFYSVLQVPKHATQRDIKRAYRKLVQTYHPDIKGNAKSDEHIKTINLAYEVLSDPDKRARYDNGSLSGLGQKQTGTYYPPNRNRRPPPYYYGTPRYSGATTYSLKTQILAWGATILIILSVIIAIYTLHYYVSDYYYTKGLEAEKNNDLEQAIHFYQEAIRDFGSKSVEASIKSAEVSQKLGAYHYMADFCERGLEFNPDSVQTATLYYLEGTALAHTERYKKAELAFLSSLAYNFDKDSVYVILGSLYINYLNKYERAEEIYTFLLSGNDLNLSNYYNRGICYQYLGEYNKAISDFEKVLADNPFHGKTLFQLGRSYLALGNKEKACEYLHFSERQGVNLDPQELAKACN